MRYSIILPFIITALISNFTFAQEKVTEVKQDEGYGDAFVNYIPYLRTVKTPLEAPLKPPALAPSPAPKTDTGKQPVTVEWLRENYPKLRDRAINNPTEANVSAQMYAQRILMDKAQKYSDMVLKVVTQDPLLDENNRVPTASGGALTVRNANYLAQEQAVRELSAVGGAIIFVDGNCRFCALEIPVMEGIRKTYGLQYLVVSVDGTVPKNFKGQAQKDNGLFNKLGLKLTPSVVFVPHPKGYAHGADQNKYFIIAQGFYAQDGLAKQIAFAGHDSKLLSADTMRDLSVWDRGVASTDDLQKLELDVNKPETFKETLQPILIKQYK